MQKNDHALPALVHFLYMESVLLHRQYSSYMIQKLMPRYLTQVFFYQLIKRKALLLNTEQKSSFTVELKIICYA